MLCHYPLLCIFNDINLIFILISFFDFSPAQQCLELNKFEAVPTEGQLVKKALDLLDNGTYWAGFVFESVTSDTSTELPPYMKYKIRMDISDVERTNKIKDRYAAPQDRFCLNSYIRPTLCIPQ